MKKMGRRIGCAALAAQMLLTSGAQAAEPLRQTLDEELHTPRMSYAAMRLESPKHVDETFPQLRKLDKNSARMVAQATSVDDTQETETSGGSADETTKADAPAAPDESTKTDTPETTDEPKKADIPATPDETAKTDVAETPDESTKTDTEPKDETTKTDDTTKPDETTKPDDTTNPDEAIKSDETTNPDESTKADTPAEDDALLPPEAAETAKPEKLVRAPRRTRGGVSTFNIAGGYLDTWTVLAIYGFGPDYKIPGSTENDDKAGSYAYNAEVKDDPTGASWTAARKAGTANEQSSVFGWLFNNCNSILDPWTYGSSYLYGQTYDATSVALDSPDEAFEWRKSGNDQHFIGQLPGADDLPRLPNKEFTGKWYVLGSKAVQLGTGYGIQVDDGRGYRTFGDYFTAVSEDINTRYQPVNYRNLVYNKDRDSKEFDPDEPLSIYTYPTYGSAFSTEVASIMDPYYDNTGSDKNVFPTLPLIGRWDPSSNATLTGLELTQKIVGSSGASTTDEAKIYPIKTGQTQADLEKMTYLDLQKAGEGFEEGVLKYFVRLPAAATELTLPEDKVLSYEPGSEVTLIADYKNSSTPEKYTLSGEDYPARGAANTLPKNNSDDPARGSWTLGDGVSIPVVKDGHVLETLTFHVDSPAAVEAAAAGNSKAGSGAKDEADYVIYIQQLQAPEMELDPGNTPMGMIQRNDAATDSLWNGTRPQDSADNFKNRYTFKEGGGGSLHPAGANNNNGYLWMDMYNYEAWSGASLTNTAPNVDLDPAAIVVYPNTTFEVPGFTVNDSLGNAAELGEIDDPNSSAGARIQNVKWTLEVTTVAKLSPNMMNDTAAGSTQKWSGEGKVGSISLADYNVKPGVYTLHYTYTDQYDGREHSGDSFDRTVVVVPLHGDVDLDGKVTPADGVALQTLLAGCESISDYIVFRTTFPHDDTSRLYYYRVCDVNGDGMVDDADVNALLQGYVPKLRDGTNRDSDYFYLPLPGDTPREATDVVVDEDATGPRISLEYLDVESSDSDDEEPSNPGEEEEEKDGRIDYDPDNDSVFWMDVRLNGVAGEAAFAGNVTSFTVTLAYDNEYVEPYLPSGVASLGEYILSQNTQWAGWKFQGSAQEQLADGDVVPADPFKANSILTDAASGGTLDEVRFSVTPTDASTNRNPLTTTDATGSILKVPFRLKKLPAGKAGKDMKLVELVFGPRDFLVATESGGAALWDNNPARYPVTDNENLKDKLAYAGSGDVKLGEDLTPCYYVYVDDSSYATDVDSSSKYGKNLVYGHGTNVTMNNYGVRAGKEDTSDNASFRVYFSGSIGSNLVWADPSNVPGDVNYNTTNGQLTITPKKAGVFEFTIENNPTRFRLVVDKSILTLTATDVEKYYGETTTTDQTFTYDVSEIQGPDTVGGTPSGKGSDLGSVIDGYKAPTIRLVTAAEDGETATATTEPGEYVVLLEGGESDDYTFQYTRADIPSGDGHISGKLGTAKLTVHPRPLLVDQVTKDPVGTLVENTNTVGIAGKADESDFTLAGLDEDSNLSGYDAVTETINGVPIDVTITVVSGDKLELAYTGEVLKNAGDPPLPLTAFTLQNDEEERDAKITSISLTDNAATQNDRYVLKNKTERDLAHPDVEYILPMDGTATASVERRKMIKLEVSQQPARLNYTYGQALDMSQLRVIAYFSDNPDVGEEAAHELANLKRDLKLDAYWVDGPEVIPGANAEAAVDGEQLHVSDRDGKYLCLVDSVGKKMRAYVGPIHVTKRTLTLTVRSETRYYGEQNPAWTIGYNFGQLAEWDRTAHPQVNGTIDELTTWMTNFAAPTAIPRETAATSARQVTATTDAGNYYVVIDHASADDYTFEYTMTGASGAEGTSAELGYAPFYIETRPILITKITDPAGSIYHDTRTYFVDPASAVAGGDLTGFQAELPQANATYYTGDFASYVWDGRLGLTGSAIHRSDRLTALYLGEFLERDNEQIPFYELAGNEQSRSVSVQATGLRLSGERSKNYLLLFPSADAATNGWAGESAADSQTTGTVYLRKIQDVELTGPTQVSYVYGDRLNLSGLTARVTYAPENGEPSVVETVVYDDITLGGVSTTTFQRLGLTLHMGSINGAPVENGQRLSVAEHNGQYIYVTAPQYEAGVVVSDHTPAPLKLQKKTLDLTVSDMTRKYGEENGTYEFTFALSDLAEWDRELVGDNALSGTADALHTEALSAALTAVNAPYESGANTFVAPQFNTLATRGSSVQGSPYRLELSGGAMVNYELVPHAGSIHVEPRPIQVTGILKDPLYTLSENLFTAAEQRPAFGNVVCTQEELELSTASADGLTGSPVVEGDNISLRVVAAVVDGTNGGTTSVDESAFGSNEYEIRRNAVVSQIELISGGDNNNYLLTNPTNGDGTLRQTITAQNQAIVHRRVIQSIRVARDPYKMTYTYGEPMDLGGMLLEITYQRGSGSETVNVDPTAMRDVFINYWDPQVDPLTADELNADDTLLSQYPAANGDHLTIAVDRAGFAHNGKKLMVSARTYDGQPYVDSVLTSTAIEVNPKELTYALSAEDKDYDHNRDAVGTITLTNVYGTDEVWVKNGTDYTDRVPSDYAFTSGNYHAASGYDGLKFAFVDENVSRVNDGHDVFEEPLDIPVEVTGIALDGWDSANYHINAEVLTTTEQLPGRDGVPSARILPIERPTPAVGTELWVDEHTNTVKVLTAQPPETFGDSADSKNTLHYEYALVYEDARGDLVITDYQDDPYFGGEPVDPEDVGVESGVQTSGGQKRDPEDTLFDDDSRTALPRGTWIGALVRLAGTNNYNASAGRSSFGGGLQVSGDRDNDAQVLAALASAAQTAAAQPLPEVGEKERLIERVKGPVIQTYTYRIDLVNSNTGRGEDNTEIYWPTLDEVWFTDIAEFDKVEALDRLVENEPVRYHGYYWDIQRKVELRFPLAQDEDILVELPVEGENSSAREETLVNPDGTMRIYVNAVAPSGGGGGVVSDTRSIVIEPGELTLEKAGDTAQLKATVRPSSWAAQGILWSSSNERVAKVSEDGTVTAMGFGTAEITATTNKGGLTATITVTVLGSKTEVPYQGTMFNAEYTGAFFALMQNGLFEPERIMTRRELAVVMNRFFQEVQDRIPGQINHYLDLGEDPANSAIENLDKWGIVNGVGKGLFAPDQAVTRAEMSTILCRMLMIAPKTDPNAPHAFADSVPGVHWAWGYIDALAEAGITKGTGDGEYSPERRLTRAEVATFLGRLIVTVVDNTSKDIVKPTDVPETHWAYSFILRSINSEPVVQLMELTTVPEQTEKTGKK